MNMESVESIPIKKRKIETDSPEKAQISPVLESFKGFEIEKVISENARCKTTTVHGKLLGENAVVLLEKTPFDKDHLQNYLSGGTTLKNTLKNDIYGTYEAFLPPSENVVKAVVIHPATDKHVQKYSDQERFVVRETSELYREETLPLLQSKQLSLQWVYNILEKKQEADHIVFEDTDPDTGFILLPDMKWDRKDTNSLYLVAIIHKHGIKSVRDLDTSSLPLLNNILVKGQKAIENKYDVPSSKLHVFIHYQPSYYHFHVHFTHVMLEAPGFGAERAHMLTDVIDNIELKSDYYADKTLTFVVREQDDLYLKYKESGYFDKQSHVIDN